MSDSSETDTTVDQNDGNVLRDWNLFENVINDENDEFIDDTDEFAPHEDNYTNTEISCTTSLECISDCLERDSSEITSVSSQSVSSQSTKDEEINDELILFEPDNPLMDKFQNTLRQHLLKQRDSIRNELFALEAVVKSKHNEKSLLVNESNRTARRVENHGKVLCEYQRIKAELTTTKEQVDTYIDQGKERYADIASKITAETKRVSDVKRTLECRRGLLNELAVYKKEQEITFIVCDQKKIKTKQNFKKLLDEKENQNLLLSSLSLEILRLEFSVIELDRQAQTTRAENGSTKQKLMDKSTDLDAITRDNNKIKLLWNDVLVCIQQRDGSCQKIKHDLLYAKNKYNVLLLESDSYKRSVEEESTRNEELSAMSKKLKRDQDSLQYDFQAYFDKIATTKENHFRSLQIIELQEHDLHRVTLEQNAIETETNELLKSLVESNNNKCKHEEDNVEELRKQTFSDSYCAQINKKILKLAGDVKQHELALVGHENRLAECSLNLEQYYTTISNLENDRTENTKYLDDHERIVSALSSELNKLYTRCQLKSKQIEADAKQLDSVNRKLEDGVLINVRTKIDRVRLDIDEIEKQIDLIKKSWIERQIKNVLLLNRSNTQSVEVRKVHSIAITMNMKSTRLLQEITDLSIENDNYTRRIADTRHAIVKLHDIFYTQRGQSNRLLNENEWMHSSYLAELQDCEKKFLDYTDAFKFLKNEFDEIRNVYYQKKLESNSWDSKLQLLTEMKNKKKIGEGDTGDIRAMKNEIRKLQFRENQLKKTLGNKMSDLEKCISKRDQIYNAFAARNVRVKRKHDMRMILLKKINDLRTDIKKIQKENKKLDRNITHLQHGKLEVECKLTCLKEKSRNVQQHIDDFNEKFDAIGATKFKNIHKLIYKHCHIKFLDEVKNGKYRSLIHSESKMNEGFEIERKKNSDLTAVVDALINDFPRLDSQFTFLFNTLKSVEY